MKSIVLILVVVDNGLVRTLRICNVAVGFGLNPCCSGQWSRTFLLSLVLISNSIRGLNPCCSGQWSRTFQRFHS